MNNRFNHRFLPTTLLFVCRSVTGCKKSSSPARSTTSTTAESASARLIKSSQIVPIAPSIDPATWEKVISAFNKELQADPTPTDPSTTVFTFKQIARAWRYKDSIVVVLEKRSEENTDWDRLFELYDYNLATNRNTPIVTNCPIFLSNFRTLAVFERDSLPDIAFETMSCTECEPEVIVSAVYFDENDGTWKLRRWADGDEGIGIDNTDSAEDPDYAALSGITDFQRSGFQQLAVWFRYRDFDQKNPDKVLPVITTLNIFGFKHGTPTKIEVKNIKEIERVKKQLCEMNPGAVACAGSR